LEQIDKLEEYETDYKNLVSDCRALLNQAKEDRVAAYWKTAERILAFRNKYEVTGFMKTLNLDLGISARTLGYLLQFRQEYETYNKRISWAYYLELLTHLPRPHRKGFQEKILTGEITSHKNLRSQMMKYRKENKISFGRHTNTHSSS